MVDVVQQGLTMMSEEYRETLENNIQTANGVEC